MKLVHAGSENFHHCFSLIMPYVFQTLYKGFRYETKVWSTAEQAMKHIGMG